MSTFKNVVIGATIASFVAYRLQYIPFLAAGALPVVAIILYGAFLCFIYPFYFSPFRDLPEPPNGSNFPWAHANLLRHETNGESLRRWTLEVPNDGLIRFRVLWNQERLLITHPDGIKEVTVEKTMQFEKPSQPAYLIRKVIGNGVLIAEGEEHRRQRKPLMPAFSFRHIKDLYPVFWAKARHSTDEISKANKGQSNPPAQRAYDWASRATLDIIGSAAIGYDFNSVGNPDGDIIQTYRSFFENEPPHFRWGMLGIYIPLKLLFPLPLPTFTSPKRTAAKIRELGFSVVKEKRARAAAVATSKTSSPDSKPVPSEIDILSIAMRSDSFTDAECVDQIMTFLAAGHETTASALTWALFHLCNHPEIQARLRAEVRAGLPSIRDPDSTVSPPVIDGLPYLNAVCNEVLRFTPSVPTTIRDAVVDTEILGRKIPKGSRVFLSPWGMNHDPNLWGKDAGEFKPERWIEDDGSANNAGGVKNNYANLTFLHGARACIGKDFAKAEFKCLLAAWIGRFEVSWEGGKALPMDVSGWVTVKPKHQLPVVFRDLGDW